MAADYPTGLKVFTSISCADKMSASGKTGVDIVTELQEEVAALQAKVGIDSSAVQTSHDYKLSAVTGADKALGASATQTVTNKTIDVDNNTVSNIEVDNFAASAVVTEAEGISSNDNDTTFPTSAAVKDYTDSQIPTLTSKGYFTISGLNAPTRIGSNDPVYTLRFTNDISNDIGLGMRMAWTQNALERNGIIVEVGAWGGSNMDVKILTRCDNSSGDYDVLDTASNAITNVKFSFADRPQGFLNDVHYWTVKEDNNDTYSTASASTSYLNISSSNLKLAVPWGLWILDYQTLVYSDYSTQVSNIVQRVALSTSTNSDSHDQMVSVFRGSDLDEIGAMHTIVPYRVNVSLDAGDDFFIIVRNSAGVNRNSISIGDGLTRNRIEAKSVYI